MGLLLWPAVAAAGLAVSYYGSRLILPSVPPMEPCNRNVQGFELRGIPIYWQVEQGQCGPGDPNFETVKESIEKQLSVLETSEWPESYCVTDIGGLSHFAFKYGTDFYDIEELDCSEQLDKVIKEAEDNFDIGEYLKNSMKQNAQGAGIQQILKHLL